MNKNSVISFGIILILVLAGCRHGTGFSTKQISTAAGTATGALTGYLVGGKHKEMWAIGGAVAGAWVGGQLGQYLEKEDRQTMTETSQKAIITGEKQTWSNSETKTSGTAEVVKEKNETAAVPVTVLKDRIKTVPPLDMIGAPYTATTTLNVRGGPGADYKIVDQLNSGQTIDVIGQVQDKPWMMIGANQVASGFVHKSYLSRLPVEQREAPTAKTVIPPEKTTCQTVSAKRTCRTVKQIIVTADGSEKEEEITACQGPNGWEPV